jgi:peroxiredoxin
VRVYLGNKPIQVYGNQLKRGDSILGNFQLPGAYNTKTPLRKKTISRGLVILSTLPNIKSNECSTQILDLEQEVQARALKLKIYHIACDCPEHWEEVKHLHPFLKAKGYSLELANKADAEEFKQVLGVGVRGSKRIVHGLFAFLNGKLISTYIPRQQYGVPNVKKFLDTVATLIDA